MPFEVVGRLHPRMKQENGSGDLRYGKRQYWGFPLLPVVTLLHSCVKAREPIELLFGVVSRSAQALVY